METGYEKNHILTTSYSGNQFLEFSGYRYNRQGIGTRDTTVNNRAGIVLDAKSTTFHDINGEMIVAHEMDSIFVDYTSSTRVVRHGRSATLSVINLFSKKENRIKQDPPSEEVKEKTFSGVIHAGIDSFEFNNDWIDWDHGRLVAYKISKVKKLKNGKIKSANGSEGILVMQNGHCYAALDYLNSEFYLDKNLSEKQRLIIAGWLGVRER